MPAAMLLFSRKAPVEIPSGSGNGVWLVSGPNYHQPLISWELTHRGHNTNANGAAKDNHKQLV